MSTSDQGATIPDETRPAAHPRPRDRPEEKKFSAVVAMVITALITVAVLGATVGLLLILSESGDSGPEAALSLVFVAAAVVLILVVCTLTIVLKRLWLTNPDEPMGLPRGSIRAVIALLLILLFFIAAIFLFNSTRETNGDRSQNRTLTGVDGTRFADIDTEDIQSVTPRTTGGTTVYDVVLYPSEPGTETSDDIAKQLITTVGTLVTAVAAFYFGANSVSSAIKDAGPPGSSNTQAEAGPGPAPTPGRAPGVVDPAPPGSPPSPVNPSTAEPVPKPIGSTGSTSQSEATGDVPLRQRLRAAAAALRQGSRRRREG